MSDSKLPVGIQDFSELITNGYVYVDKTRSLYLFIKQEAHYHSLFYLLVKLAGININAEFHTQRGRVDVCIELTDKIILFELKLNETAQLAIDQIKERKYYEIFSDRKLPTYMVGLNFNSHTRTVDDFIVELLG